MSNNLINEEIKAKRVLLIDNTGNKVGELSKAEALEKAYETNLDLVQVSNQEIPVCKIMDYNKHLFEEKKKKKNSSIKESRFKWKEIQLSLSIGNHDLETKAKSALKHMEKGNKVKVILTLKGREISNKDFATGVMLKFKNKLENVTIEKDVYLEGNKLIMHLSK